MKGDRADPSTATIRAASRSNARIIGASQNFFLTLRKSMISEKVPFLLMVFRKWNIDVRT